MKRRPPSSCDDAPHAGRAGLRTELRRGRAPRARLNRQVALKVAADVERLERYRREAQAVAALNHPNIVTSHSVEEADGVHFITLELVDGRTLDKLIPAGSRFPTPSDTVGRSRAAISHVVRAHP